ncbi:MAG: hypothetical protein WKF92_11060 [Pyrinomonadaceae bacterium]
MDDPVVPVAIQNTDWIMGKKTGVLYGSRKFEIMLMPPIESRDADDLMELITKKRFTIASELAA